MGRSAHRTDKKGHTVQSEHWTKLTRELMEASAWRALSTTAQALYPWIRLEWKGPRANNNGKIVLSVRQAAHAIGVTRNTAARAFHDLQAKGFLVMTALPSLGVAGEAKAPTYELTEIPLPTSEHNCGRRLYKEWRKGSDFPVATIKTHNPNGVNGKACHQNEDYPVIKFATFQENQSSK